jgi:hypothetical protein
MSKITLTSLENLQSETTAVQAINENFDAIEAAMELTLSRNGETPNQMTAPLDMNSQRIINLAAPVNNTDAVRLMDIQDLQGPQGEQGPQGIPGPAGNGSGDMLRSNNLSDLTNTTTARTNLGAQASSTNLTSLAGLTGAADKVAMFTGVGTLALFDAPAFGRSLLAATTAAASRTLLGLTSIATAAFGSTAGSVAEGNDSRFSQLAVVTKDTTSDFTTGELAKFVRHTSGSTHTWTIPSGYGSVGSVLSLRNAVGGGVVTVAAAGGVTLYKAGGTSSGSVTIANGGLGSLVQEATNVWVISGAGVT